MSAKQAHEICLGMGEAAVNHVFAHGGCANVQHHEGTVFVSLTMMNIRTGVWMIGIPTPGQDFFVTDNVNEAEAEIARLLDLRTVAGEVAA